MVRIELLNKRVVDILGLVVVDEAEVPVVEETDVLLGCLPTEEVLTTAAT
jgi:hypothetical protein